tara:strand:- start:109 stop:630 length:522 start_codon:yes stop_codon:yes gene_type:complete
MQLKEMNKALNAFGKYVVQQARTRLTKNKAKKKRGYASSNTGELYDSLSYRVEDTAQGSRIYFDMEEYGMFQDRGVSGTKQKYKTPFSYTTKQPPSEPIKKWAKFNNIRLRNKEGKYTKGNYNTIAFLIARSIKEKGIKPSLFFTTPFKKAFKNLPNELGNAFGFDTDNLLSK